MKIDNKTIRSVLRQIDQGFSNRAIARHQQLSPTTVAKIRKLHYACTVDIDELLAADDTQMRKLLGLSKVYNPHKTNSIKPHPDWAYINQEMARPDMTLELLWQEFKSAHPDGIGYSQFCEQYRKYKKAARPSKRQSYKAGDMVQVDFCGRTVPIYDERTGKVVIHAQIFVGVLPASGYLFCTAVASQKIDDWQVCHIRMFDYFGGVPQKLVTDNLKSAVIRNNKAGIMLNASYSELADHYGIIILPARPRKPKDKSMAELAVRIVQMGILAKLRGRRFFDLDELNQALTQQLAILNTKTTKRYPQSRYTSFINTDALFLNPLPDAAYEVCQWIYGLKVSEFYTVTVGKASYSVPHQFILQRVDVKLTKQSVCIYLNRQLIATHPLIASGNSILNEHMLKHHRLQDEMQPERLIAWAHSVGESTTTVIDRLLQNKAGFANNLKKLNQLKRYLLEQQLPPSQIEQGFDYAQKLNISAVDRIISLFKNKAYQQHSSLIVSITNAAKMAERLDDTMTGKQSHQNIRGSSYYAHYANHAKAN